ncbi:pyocin knob domain-containing protein, partial [Trabulsiella odontotermitis]|uniref:pyocin knob domain-containing protein n=1 Tax=Trabulsiella odontotermitis TaxID=379893 RepID=UPI00092D24F4
MKRSDVPTKHALPFALNGSRNAIPENGTAAGAASLTKGFPDETMTPIIAGGTPPDGKDMNGVLHELSAMGRWANAGAEYSYDEAFSTSIGGYPRGARLLGSDGVTMFVSMLDDNSTDPEVISAAWEGYNPGRSGIALTAGIRTLTALEAASSVIVLTGTLTGNVQLVFPVWVREWDVINLTTGAFTVTCRTGSGGVTADEGFVTRLYGDGNILNTWAEMDVEGMVKTVNDHKPDEHGNVTVTAADTGALPLNKTALAVDLNTLGTNASAGVYFQPVTGNATAGSHYPINEAGTMVITPSAYGCQQEYTS